MYRSIRTAPRFPRTPICRLLHTGVLITALASLWGCERESGAPPAQQGPPPAVPVSVAEVLQVPVHAEASFTATLESPQQVELRPRVSGYIEAVAFTEGEQVAAGDALFRIESASFLAERKRLEAEQRSAEARLQQALADRKRAASLRDSKAISAEALETRQTAVLQAEANLQALTAALESARLNLSWANVLAPVAGLTSYARVTPGNFVAAGTTVLTTLVATDRMYAWFDVDEARYLRIRAAQPANPRSRVKGYQFPVLMQLANEEGYPHRGQINFVDNQVNPQTGTVRVRAVFDNMSGLLAPGLFVRVKVLAGEAEQAILIDEQAIATDLANKYVLALNADDTVAYRPVVVGAKVAGLRRITSGLEAGDRIVVRGLQRIFPGMTAAPEIMPMADEATLQTLRRTPASPAPGESER